MSQLKSTSNTIDFTGNWFIDIGILGFVNVMEEVYGWDLNKLRDKLNEPEKVYYGYFPFAYFSKLLKDYIRSQEKKKNSKKETEKESTNVENDAEPRKDFEHLTKKIMDLRSKLEQELKSENDKRRLFDLVWHKYICELYKDAWIKKIIEQHKKGKLHDDELKSIIEKEKHDEEKLKKDLAALWENKVQLWQEDLIRQVGNKNYLVLIAPTGSGKTEFALMWAIQKGRKLVYTLPLRVALNDMYSRFDENNKGYFDANYLSILHSTSFIEYVKVMRGVVSSGGGYDMLDVGTKQNIARQFSSPVILTTPDQVFLTSLKYYGFDKLIIIYPLCTFIIDEIQAYKPDMVAIVLKTIDVIQKLHGNVLVITATFPPYLKDFLEQRNFEIIDVKNSVVDKNKIKNYALRRHRIKVVDKSLFKEDKKAVRRVKENKKLLKK